MVLNNLNYTIPQLISFPSVGTPDLGYITVTEVSKNIPFDVKRVYWTYFTPHNVKRGGHAHKELEQLIFAVCGTIRFSIESLDGYQEEFVLSNPDVGLYIPRLVWRDIQFSHNAVLVCLASEQYIEEDYIRKYEDFIKLRK